MDKQVTDEINRLTEEKYNGYRGRMLRPLMMVHTQIRCLVGDKMFLEYLKKLDGLPKCEYKISNENG